MSATIRTVGLCCAVTALAGTVLLSLITGGHLRAQEPKPYTTWSDYGGSPDSMQYSALAQIDKNNVKQLERAWFYQVTGDPVRLPFNPLIVDGVMYVAGAKDMVVALDAATGKELWTSTEEATERGITYWESKDRADRRLILTTNTGLKQIDAKTGRLITTFGSNGLVDMRTGSPRRLGGPNKSPGRVFENLLIVGSNTGEGYGSPPGDVRAYDVVTGKLVWTFHTIPRPGEFGYDTWPAGRVAVRRRREHLGRHHARHEERHRLLSTGIADARSLRRRSRRRQSVRQLPGRARRAHGQAALAFSDRAPRSLGLRPRVRRRSC